MERAKLVKALKCCSHRNCQDCPLRDTVCGGITRLAAYAAQALENAPAVPAEKESPVVEETKLIKASTEEAFQLCKTQLELKGYTIANDCYYKMGFNYVVFVKDGKAIGLERNF